MKHCGLVIAAIVSLEVFGAVRLAAQTVQNLTLAQAEKIAIQNHPQVQAAQYIAAAASARVGEQRSNYFPTADGSATGVKAENDSRIAAGALNNPIIFNRFADGIEVRQLVTDFGRTHELVKSSELHAKAEDVNVTTARADVLLRVDEAYFALLKAQSVLQVANETVKDRQLVSDQITTLAKNDLKSGLDVSFANVDLSQAQLLLVQARNDVQASNAELSAALGYADERRFLLVESPLPPAPLGSLADFIQQALRNRPELLSQQLDVLSAQTYATAERDLWFPKLSAAGAAGLTPIHDSTLAPRYAAAGFNLNIPIFNGHLFGSLRAEANAQARAQQQYLRAEQDGVVRDVQKAWLNANSGYQRLGLTDQLLAQASKALDLAQARYKLGLSSIVELSQAQLNKTEAEIAQTSAKYDYQAELSALNYQAGALH
ncbi:MAG: TolC family protein [Candidatus Acidiferrales bacterium]